MSKTRLVSITFAKDKRKNHVFNFYEGTELIVKQGCPGTYVLDHEETIEEISDWFKEQNDE